MSKRNIIIGLGVAVAVLAGAVWFFFLKSDAPPPVSLEEQRAAVSGETTTTVTGSVDTTSASETTVADSDAGLDGVWTVDPADSFVGYRIEEELASLGSVTAAGRTSEINATLAFAGSAVTELSVTVDMTTLESDRSQRDKAMRSRGLETDTFAESSFVLTAPIELGSVPGDGDTITATAEGELSMHGTTQAISLDIEGSLVGETMVVVGSVEIALADYGIEKPTGFSVLDIADTGILEIALAFVRG